MSKKSAKIAELIESLRGQRFDAHYLGYFACFNRGMFYDSHDVLEELWLGQREGPNYSFYKGLIQFAGAFVHLQKHTAQRPRLHPAAALFRLARANLQKYPRLHEGFDVTTVLVIIDDWLGRLERGKFQINPLHPDNAPKLTVPSVEPG